MHPLTHSLTQASVLASEDWTQTALLAHALTDAVHVTCKATSTPRAYILSTAQEPCSAGFDTMASVYLLAGSSQHSSAKHRALDIQRRKLCLFVSHQWKPLN